MDDNEYITLGQAAKELHCSKEKLLRAHRSQQLKTRKPGREIITTRDWLRKWLDQEERAQPEEA